MDYVPCYSCPRGCKGENGNVNLASTVRGWKKHMTAKHGGYNEEELNAIVSSSPSQASTSGKEQFLNEINGAPVAETAQIHTDATGGVSGKPDKTVEVKTDAVGKKFNAKLNKLKKSLADKFPQTLAAAVKDSGPEWALSSEDTLLLSESIENCFDVLDVDFRIAPMSWTLENPLWVLLLPALALVLVFVPKGIRAAQLKQAQEENTTEEVPVSEA